MYLNPEVGIFRIIEEVLFRHDQFNPHPEAGRQGERGHIAVVIQDLPHLLRLSTERER